MRRVRRLAGALVCALALVAFVPASAPAAPRISGVSIPATVTGYSGASFGSSCDVADPVPMTFTASAPGTMAVLMAGPSLFRVSWGSLRFRAGANSVDLNGVPSFLGGGDRPANRRRMTFAPVGRQLDVGSPFTRTLVATC